MPQLLLIAMALVEACTGLVLILAPSFIVWLLLGEGLTSPQSLILSRITGAVLLSIGVACWRARNGEPSERRGLVRSMLIYNCAVPAILFRAATADGLRGIAIWPTCLLHVGLAIWCVLSLKQH